METFEESKTLAGNPYYQQERKRILSDLRDDMIDFPIIGIINGLNRLRYCFTLQSCYGHFLYDRQTDPHNIEPLPITDRIPKVTYRIAYISFCVENTIEGKKLLQNLKRFSTIDPLNIQFGSPQWFWKIHLNSYALQVEPDRFKMKDRVSMDCGEALKIEKLRNIFFTELEDFLKI